MHATDSAYSVLQQDMVWTDLKISKASNIYKH